MGSHGGPGGKRVLRGAVSGSRLGLGIRADAADGTAREPSEAGGRRAQQLLDRRYGPQMRLYAGGMRLWRRLPGRPTVPAAYLEISYDA